MPVCGDSAVSLGAVGYYRTPQEFTTLFNAFHPEEAMMKAVRTLPSLYDYVNGIYEKKGRVQMAWDAVVGFLSSDKLESPGS
jgi:hypothetical protein